jgi:hypothetical protein
VQISVPISAVGRLGDGVLIVEFVDIRIRLRVAVCG